MENSKGVGRNTNQDLDQQNKRSGVQEDITHANSDHNQMTPNRGGTTDMGSDNAQRGASGGSTRTNSGSGIRTKRTVTGSDYDGQVAED